MKKNEEFRNMINEEHKECVDECRKVQISLEKVTEESERDFLIETEKLWKQKINYMKSQYVDILG